MADNKTKVVVNPFTSEPQLLNDVQTGITIRKSVLFPMTVRSGFTHLHGRTIVPEGIVISIEEDAEWIAI